MSERRATKRYDKFLTVECKPHIKSGEFFLGITRNISTEGFSMETQRTDLKIGDILEFKLNDPHSGLKVNLYGEVIWNRESWYKHILGVRFHQTDEKNKEKINELIFAVKDDAPKPDEKHEDNESKEAGEDALSETDRGSESTDGVIPDKGSDLSESDKAIAGDKIKGGDKIAKTDVPEAEDRAPLREAGLKRSYIYNDLLSKEIDRTTGKTGPSEKGQKKIGFIYKLIIIIVVFLLILILPEAIKKINDHSFFKGINSELIPVESPAVEKSKELSDTLEINPDKKITAPSSEKDLKTSKAVDAANKKVTGHRKAIESPEKKEDVISSDPVQKKVNILSEKDEEVVKDEMGPNAVKPKIAGHLQEKLPPPSDSKEIKKAVMVKENEADQSSREMANEPVADIGEKEDVRKTVEKEIQRLRAIKEIALLKKQKEAELARKSQEAEEAARALEELEKEVEPTAMETSKPEKEVGSEPEPAAGKKPLQSEEAIVSDRSIDQPHDDEIKDPTVGLSGAAKGDISGPEREIREEMVRNIRPDIDVNQIPAPSGVAGPVGTGGEVLDENESPKDIWEKIKGKIKDVSLFINRRSIFYPSLNTVQFSLKSSNRNEEYINLLVIDCFKKQLYLINDHSAISPVLASFSTEWRDIPEEYMVLHESVCLREP